jgi:hypothetical protein
MKSTTPWETSVLASAKSGIEWGICEPGAGDMVATFHGPNAETNARLTVLISYVLPYITLEDEGTDKRLLLDMISGRILDDIRHLSDPP